jgi:serine/threonine protein kinase
MAENIESIMDEVEILNKLDHPNIANHIETYDDTNLVYIGKFWVSCFAGLVLIPTYSADCFN